MTNVTADSGYCDCQSQTNGNTLFESWEEKVNPNPQQWNFMSRFLYVIDLTRDGKDHFMVWPVLWRTSTKIPWMPNRFK